MSKLLELALAPSPEEDESRPLADRMRPQKFADVLGQEHLLGDGTLFSNALRNKIFPSVVLWGPPGCGKTTIARLIAEHSDAVFVSVSAISSATADLRKIFSQAEADKNGR